MEPERLTESFIDFACSLTRDERNWLLDVLRQRYETLESIALTVEELRALLSERGPI